MLLGLIADTHGHLPANLADVFAGCELILHAGDIGGSQVLAELERIAPVLAVLGNNDWLSEYPKLPLERRLLLAGVSIYLAHEPVTVQRYLRGCTGRNGAPTLPDLCIHGHTHLPQNEIVRAQHWLCPGSAFRPRGGSRRSVARLDLDNGRILNINFQVVE
ncbi:MAG: metallophosphatase family protein [Actinomycetia bacterium]|nr:metallophosphatase family protein [Actinomycetes bacterium]